MKILGNSESSVSIIPFCLCLFLMAYLPLSGCALQTADSLEPSPDEWQTLLTQKVSKANNLYSNQKGDLQLAISILEISTAHDARSYYELASFFYQWSLEKATIENDFQIIKKEAQRLMPLLPDDEKDAWETLLENKNPALLNNMRGFWVTQDASPSTNINERLLQHWKRIAYVRKNFSENDSSPYGTDARGMLYIRLGPPDKRQQKTVRFNKVTIPTGGQFRLNSGPPISGTFELWNYYFPNNGNALFVFGQDNGIGEYELKESIFDVFDLSTADFSKIGSSGSSRRSSEKIARYGILQQVYTFQNQYQQIYQKINSRLTLNGGSILSAIRGSEEFFDRAETQRKINFASSEKTNQIGGNNSLDLRHRFYRFRDEQNEPKYVLSTALKPEQINTSIKFHRTLSSVSGIAKNEEPAAGTDSTSYYTQNNLYVYDQDWKLLDRAGQVIRNPEGTSVFSFKKAYSESQLFFSTELLGLTDKNSATLVSATGKQKLKWPEPLPKTSPFTVSDIILTNEQDPDFEKELPILPKMGQVFKKNQPLMIYFEAYGVPEGGYSFTYFFKKDRWLRSHKKIERTEITVLADKVKERDSQLFSIDIPDFEPGTYELVFQYSPLENDAGTEPIEKKIEIEIKE